MSHVRNLFLKSPAQVSVAPAVPAAAAPAMAMRPDGNHGLHTKPISLSDFAAKAPALPEFAVEQAHVRAEHRLVTYTDPHSPVADRFRYLRMRLREPWSAGKLKRLLITSPLANEGKSTVILNLATTLAERGRRSVLVVEADLHKSCLCEQLGLKTWAGLSECLRDVIDPLTAIRRVDPFGWYILPAGEPHKSPTELLQTPALGTIIQRVSPHFDWMLIDSAPAVPLTDAISIQQHSDATLLVVRAGRTPREAIEQAVSLLGPKNIFGVVFNGVSARNHLYAKYQSYD